MRSHHFAILILLVGLLLSPVALVSAQDNPPVVRAVLFHSPQCPHCQIVINETLPPIIQKYGEKLQIIGIDVTQKPGQTLFLAALNKFEVTGGGVPFLVIDNTYLIGSDEIPQKFPDLIESLLAQGSADWPEIPGLVEAIHQDSSASMNLSEPIIQSSGKTNWIDNFLRDPAGNTLAVVVLVGMFASVIWTVTHFKKTKRFSHKVNRGWIIPIFCVIGFGVASYLAFVETAQVAAVCGPVGDCNTVQQSEYARLFGVLPIGILGMIGYVTILIVWGVNRFAHNQISDFTTLSLLALTGLGTLFSIYLTFLEPFVIGATCAWCLTSAVVMTILMLLMARPSNAVFSRLAHAKTLHRKHKRASDHYD